MWRKKNFFAHLKIFRRLCFIVILFFIFCFFFTYFFIKKYILFFYINLIKNLKIINLLYFNIYDGFLLPIKICLYFSIFNTFILFYFFICLFLKSFKFLFLLIPIPICFYINYNYIIPITWKFFFSISPLLGYYAINSNMLFTFINEMIFNSLIIIYLPICMYIFYKKKIISLEQISFIRKYWYLFSIIIGGIFAPPDIISHLFMSFFLIFFFEILFLFK